MAWLARGLILTLCLVAFGGCKQGLGERCEIDSDCEDGLTCSESKKECTGGAEATDGGFIDAAFSDARPDGPVVDGATAPDAEGAPDAEVPDAEVPDAASLPDAPP